MARFRRKREALPERRAAFRFPVQGPRSEGTLRAGKAEFGVTVLDESAGGYAVTFVGPTQCRIGDRLELSVGDHWIPVRVAFVEMEDIGIEQVSGGLLQGHSRLGLERLPEDLGGWHRPRGIRMRFRRPLVMLRKNSLLLSAVGFLAALSLVGISVMRKLDRAYALNPLKNDDSEARVAPVKKSLNLTPKAQWVASQAAQAAASGVQSSAEIAEAPPLAEHVSARARVQPSPATAPEEPPRARQAVITRSAAPQAKRLGRMAAEELEDVAEELSGAMSSFDESTIRLADPQFLLRQDIAQRLQLTQAQQAWLKRLVVEHRTADGGSSDELALNRRALNRLTSEQRKLLMALEHSLQRSGQ